MRCTTEPVTIIESGQYVRREGPMTRNDGSPVMYLKVLALDAPLGTVPTQIPVGRDVDLNGFVDGTVVTLVVSLRTENVARISQSGSAYNQTVIKQRVEHVEYAPVGAA